MLKIMAVIIVTHLGMFLSLKVTNLHDVLLNSLVGMKHLLGTLHLGVDQLLISSALSFH